MAVPVRDYEHVAAGQTTQVMGPTGKVGDVLERVIIIPTAAAAGLVAIKDGSDTAIQIFDGGGTTALADLKPIVVELGITSRSGAWQITTGSNVRAIGVGRFT